MKVRLMLGHSMIGLFYPANIMKAGEQTFDFRTVLCTQLKVVSVYGCLCVNILVQVIAVCKCVQKCTMWYAMPHFYN